MSSPSSRSSTQPIATTAAAAVRGAPASSFPLLASVLVALRTVAGAQVAALPHVTLVISDYLDYALLQFWSLSRAYEANLLSLLPRLAARGISTDVGPHYWAYQCSQGLVSAVKQDNLAMVERLHECCPSVLPYAAMIEAAKTENLRSLEWFADHHERVVCSANDERRCLDRSNRGAPVALLEISCSPPQGLQPHRLGCSRGHLHIVQWLHEHHPNGCTEAAMDNAAQRRSFEVLQWLHES